MRASKQEKAPVCDALHSLVHCLLLLPLMSFLGVINQSITLPAAPHLHGLDGLLKRRNVEILAQDEADELLVLVVETAALGLCA